MQHLPRKLRKRRNSSITSLSCERSLPQELCEESNLCKAPMPDLQVWLLEMEPKHDRSTTSSFNASTTTTLSLTIFVFYHSISLVFNETLREWGWMDICVLILESLKGEEQTTLIKFVLFWNSCFKLLLIDWSKGDFLPPDTIASHGIVSSESQS